MQVQPFKNLTEQDVDRKKKPITVAIITVASQNKKDDDSTVEFLEKAVRKRS